MPMLLAQRPQPGKQEGTTTNMIVFLTPLLFKLPDFSVFAHVLITSLLHNIVRLKE